MKKLLHTILAIMIAALGAFPTAAFPCSAAAAETYTSAIDDLKLDPNFDAAIYPRNNEDHSLQVIQIAESVNGELFVYVYQPSGDDKRFAASSINISTDSEALHPRNYVLERLSVSGVFGKYKVNGLAVGNDRERYYEIVSIFRPWVSGIDKPADKVTENTISEVSFAVGKRYAAQTVNGIVKYACKETETILITEKYCGYVRYSGGIQLFPHLYVKDCDAWYVAFTTDQPIEKLTEAEVYYISQHYTQDIDAPSPMNSKVYVGDKLTETVELHYTDKVESTGGLFGSGDSYEWERIETVSEFIKGEDLTSEAKASLQGKKWVLRFVETEFHEKDMGILGSHNRQLNGTEISEVTILRLKFETDGVVYNLGVVDNKQTAGTTPDNVQNKYPWWTWLITVIVVIFVLALLCGLIKPLAEIVLFLLKCVWWIVSAPFRFIAWLVNRAGKNKEKRRKKDKNV